MTSNGFNPLNIAKRKLNSYTRIATSDFDDESSIGHGKRTSSDSTIYSSPSSSTSSRASSGSHSPMSTSLRRSPAIYRKAEGYSYRAPRRFTRYFALALGSTLVIFILTLTRSAWLSTKYLQYAPPRPKPPPVWESFAFLKRYHGGIRTLVSREDNVPEYPGNDTLLNIPPSPGYPRPSKREDGAEAGSSYGPLPQSNIFNPYPDYNSEEYRSKYGEVHECFLDTNGTVRVPMLHAYNGTVKGMPDNAMGSYEVLGLRNDVCFERFGRLGPYGLGYSRKMGGSGAGMEGDREGIDLIWEKDLEVDYRNVKWAEAQKRCLVANAGRFRPHPRARNNVFEAMAVGGPENEMSTSSSKVRRQNQTESLPQASGTSVETSPEETRAATQTSSTATEASPEESAAREYLPRHALLIRTWTGYQYDDEDLFFLRALVAELSLMTGGEYTIHFLIHVKDDNLQIWADDTIYQKTVDDALPPEFHGMGTLWSERQMGLIYGGIAESMYRDLPVHGAYRSTFMPVQYFAHMHPEYDYFWNWEMDIRYTGHYYHLFDRAGKWAKQQPRKFMWERNSRFYIPSKHGSWEDFIHMVRIQTEQGTSSSNNIWSDPNRSRVWADLAAKNPNLPESVRSEFKVETPIWGPEPPLDDKLETQSDPKPPLSIKEDSYQWGVGEEADLITFNPLFDPAGTNWILAEDVTGYNTTRSLPPRRTAINTASRLSRRLLETMHNETTHLRHTMFSEMWPGSAALHHGLKAVFAPHPVFIDRQWPTDYLAQTFNNGRNGASGGARTSCFSDERQHNFRGTTWYYNAGFAPNLWKRWLGYKVDNDGGEMWELANEGRMCLPAMLLHPVKQVDLVFEHKAGEE